MPADRPRLRVEVCRALPDSASRIGMEVDEGCTAGEALVRSGLVRDDAAERAALSCAIFGRRVSPDTRLHDGDRIELLRPLIVDPKEARRRRALKRTGAATPPHVEPERD